MTTTNAISIFPKGKPGKEGKIAPATIPAENVSIDAYLEDIRDGRWELDVLAFRKGQIKKIELPGATPSGIFTRRSAKDLVKHSGFIAIDIDAKDQVVEDLQSLRAELDKDKYTYAIHSSVSGNGGLVVYVKINPERHLDSFLALEKYYFDNYQVIIDKSGKDVSRYRFISFDPELTIHARAHTFRAYLKKAQIEPVRHSFVFTDGDLDHVFEQIVSKGIDITNDYHDWYRIGGALQNYYGGQRGRDLFHQVSQMSHKYDQKAVDDLYSVIEKRQADKIATIGTFLWLAKNAGVDIKTRRTEHIQRAATMKRKSVGTSGGPKNDTDARASVIKSLELEGISGNDVEQVVEQVWKLPESDLTAKSDNVLADLRAFLSGFDIKFNEITRNYELNGEPMTDRDYNSIYIQAVDQVDERITKDRLFSLIDSDNTPSYNPFHNFINKYRHLKPEGNFAALCKCITYNMEAEHEGATHYVDDYLEVFLKKWMMGVISSMHGVYSILILVFTGGQRAGKTKFFRNLMPAELEHFYAESKLDEGKDSEILMTKKLLIMDDEFGGKSKQDAKRLKELSSKQWFNIRRPFGRTSEDLQRLAVLCGTSNEEEVINDPTGNRRIIPVNIIDIDHEAMEQIDKVALWMEIYHEWAADKEKFMLTPGEIEWLNKCTENNLAVSVEREMATAYLEHPQNGFDGHYVTNSQIINYIKEKHHGLILSPMKMGMELKKMGFNKKNKKINGVSIQVYNVKWKP